MELRNGNQKITVDLEKIVSGIFSIYPEEVFRPLVIGLIPQKIDDQVFGAIKARLEGLGLAKRQIADLHHAFAVEIYREAKRRNLMIV